MGDPILMKMAKATGDFERAMRSGQPPHWLTFWGSSGTGKTFLARQLHGMRPGKAHWLDWVKLCRRFQSREDYAGRLERAAEAPLLIIDDIGAEHQTAGTVGLLHGLLQARLGRWTVITTNHSPDRWREVDERISSRMIRGDNRHVCCATVDFATRRPI